MRGASLFLTGAAPGEWFDEGAHLACYGTEPFWDLDIRDDVARFNTPFTDAPVRHALNSRARALGQPGPLGLQFGEGFAVIRAAECSDGMSDRTMALEIDLFLPGEAGLAGYSGCCSLAR